MRAYIGLWLSGLILTSACSAEESGDRFRVEMDALQQAAYDTGHLTVEGKDGWLFHANELRFLSVGPFWGENAARVSRAMKPTSADPIPGIVGFHQALLNRGIELLVVPVPPKAAVYPQMISSLPGGTRYDQAFQAFNQALRARGVDVLDLTDALMAMDELAFCKTDTHWSPAGCRVAAREIAARIKTRPWAGKILPIECTAEQQEITFTGDLWQSLDGSDPQAETLPFIRIGKRDGGATVPVGSDEASPVILMGDSHTIVYQDGTLLASQGGLPDLLTQALGFELDLQFRNKGSGSTVVRRSLARKQIAGARNGEDYLAGKKFVVWCFTARDLTEATDGWQVMPIEKKQN